MKKFLVVMCILASTQAFGATAYLQSCTMGNSVTGRMVYIGTYNYAGNIFQRAFASYCPNQVEVF